MQIRKVDGELTHSERTPHPSVPHSLNSNQLSLTFSLISSIKEIKMFLLG